MVEFTRRTGGEMHVINGNLQREDNIVLFEQELVASVSAVTAFEAVLKLRTSTGYRAERYIGKGTVNEPVR
jgi:hypothetical protein